MTTKDHTLKVIVFICIISLFGIILVGLISKRINERRLEFEEDCNERSPINRKFVDLENPNGQITLKTIKKDGKKLYYQLQLTPK